MDSTRSSMISRLRNFEAVTQWAEFDRLYRPMLSQYAVRRGLDPDSADEVAQQCMEAVVGKIKTFRVRSSFRGWLRKIVDNKVKQLLAQRRKNSQAPTAVFLSTPDRGLTPTQIWDNQWHRAHLLYCLDTLRAEFTTQTFKAFEMYVLQELPVGEICSLLKVTPNQIYVSKSRVMARLKATYRELLDALYGGKK